MHRTPPRGPRTLGDYTWHTRAACRPTPDHPVDPELFFPEPDEMDRIRAAKELCSRCPVIATCLEAALEDGDRIGIRGGMTEEERELLHRNLYLRLDYDRVNATLAGRDIHLTDAERRTVVRGAFHHDIPAARLAWLLKITEEHAEKLYRRTRREIRNRALDEQHQDSSEHRPPQSTSAERPSDRGDFGTAA